MKKILSIVFLIALCFSCKNIPQPGSLENRLDNIECRLDNHIKSMENITDNQASIIMQKMVTISINY